MIRSGFRRVPWFGRPVEIKNNALRQLAEGVTYLVDSM